MANQVAVVEPAPDRVYADVAHFPSLS
jgi:hypothetical protein